MTMLGTNSGGVFFARISYATLRTRAQGTPNAAPAFAERMVFTMRLLFRADRALAVDPEVTPTRRYLVLEQVSQTALSEGTQGGGATEANASEASITEVRSAGHLYS